MAIRPVQINVRDSAGTTAVETSAALSVLLPSVLHLLTVAHEALDALSRANEERSFEDIDCMSGPAVTALRAQATECAEYATAIARKL